MPKLTQLTRIDRINSKLKKYGLQLSFHCYDLKTWTPCLVTPIELSFEHKIYELYGISIEVTVKSNSVRFYVKDLKGIDVKKQTGDWFALYRQWVVELEDCLNYCNYIDVQVPKYVNGLQKW